MNDEIINVEKEILSGIDRLDNLLSQFIEINKPIRAVIESFNLILYFKKKYLLKNIKIELDDLSDNINLFVGIFRGKKPQQLEYNESLGISNNNIKQIAINLVKITPKYLEIKELDKELARSWRTLQYELREQDEITNEHNKRFVKNINYGILSILTELKMESEQKNVDYNIFLSKSYPKMESIIENPLSFGILKG